MARWLKGPFSIFLGFSRQKKNESFPDFQLQYITFLHLMLITSAQFVMGCEMSGLS